MNTSSNNFAQRIKISNGTPDSLWRAVFCPAAFPQKRDKLQC